MARFLTRKLAGFGTKPPKLSLAMKIAILILAAGASSRMGDEDKLLWQIDGQPLLVRSVKLALATGATVGVTLPVPGTKRREILDGLDVRFIDVPDAQTGMSASLKAGAEEFANYDGLAILPADMPNLTTEDLKSTIKVFEQHNGQRLVRGHAESGAPGHPVIFPRKVFADFASLSGDKGAARMLKNHIVIDHTLPDDNAVIDLDTPQDWAKWRKSQN